MVDAAKLDQEIVKNIAAQYTQLIKTVLDSDARDRFNLAIKICERARNLLALDSPRVSDFDRQLDENNEVTMNGGGVGAAIYGGHMRNIIGGGFGDNAEMMRQLVDAATSSMTTTRRDPPKELNELLSARVMLRADGENVDDLDAKIRSLRAEITGGATVIVGAAPAPRELVVDSV